MLEDMYETAKLKMSRGKSVDEIRSWLNDMANSRNISWETASSVMVRVLEGVKGEERSG